MICIINEAWLEAPKSIVLNVVLVNSMKQFDTNGRQVVRVEFGD